MKVTDISFRLEVQFLQLCIPFSILNLYFLASRNICRYCRLIKCREIGGLRMVGKNLVVQFNGYPKDDIDDESEIVRNRLNSQEEPTSTTNIECLGREPTTSTGFLVS